MRQKHADNAGSLFNVWVVQKTLDGGTRFCLAKVQVSLVDVTLGENSNDLGWFRYPRLNLYVVENFIWIGSSPYWAIAIPSIFFLSPDSHQDMLKIKLLLEQIKNKILR